MRRARSPCGGCWTNPVPSRSPIFSAISARGPTSRRRSPTGCSAPSPSGRAVSRMPPVETAIGAALADLKTLLGARATDAPAAREQHSHDESYHPFAAPDIVCFPRTTEEVSAIVGVSAAHQMPIIPFGAGTSLEGHVNAIHGGITIDF